MREHRHLPLADTIALSAESAARQVRCYEPGSPDSDRMRFLSDDGAAEAEERLLVGDLAKISGKTVRAIHHYEELGLLRPSSRSKGRYRIYDYSAVQRLTWIGKMHDLGLSLAQIQEIVQNWESAPSAPHAMARVREIYQKKLEETRLQIQHLRSLELDLMASVRYLDTCDTCDPNEIVQACSSCHVHDKGETPPNLVAGIHRSIKKEAAA